MRAQVINHWHLGLKMTEVYWSISWLGAGAPLKSAMARCSGRIFSWTCALWHPAASDYLVCFHCIGGFIFVMRDTQHFWWCKQEVWHLYALATEDPFDSPDPRLPPAELPGPVVQQREVGIEELPVVLIVFLCRIHLLQSRVLPSISNCFSTKVSIVQLPMLVLDIHMHPEVLVTSSMSMSRGSSSIIHNYTIQVPRVNQHCQDMVRFLPDRC